MERMTGENQPGLTARPCEYCGKPIPDRRKDARFCSTSHRVMASRRRRRQAEIHESLVARGGPEFTDQSHTDPDDEAQDDEHPAAYRPRKWVEDDERFAAIVADDEGTARSQQTPRSAPLDAWRGWRVQAKANPGVEPREQQADRIDRHKAARDAQAGRIDAMWPGRVQDRHDPRTAANPGRMGAESRKLNQRHVETPPSWATSEFDFQAGESWTGGPYRAGRSESGQRSRSANYAWRGLDDGFRF